MRIPFRIDSARCKKCPALVNAANAQGLPRAGNTNMPGSFSTRASRRSEQIRLNKGKPTTVIAPLNRFKQRPGGPTCSNLRPRNTF